MTAETILATTMGGATVAALIFVIARHAGQSAFLYANARMTARSNLIVDKNKLSQIMASRTLSDFANQLKDTEYSPYLESIDKNNITQFNMALEEGLLKTFEDIKSISPKKFKAVFDAYTKIYESKLIKTFFRSRFANISIERSLLEPIGSINPQLLQHLHDTKSIADVKLVLRDTAYSKIFEQEFKSIEDFDIALEQQVIDDIDSCLEKAKFSERKAILGIFHKRRVIKQILTLLKFRIRETDIETQKKLISLPSVDLDKVTNASTIEEFVTAFEGTEYEKALKNALVEFQKTQSFHSFERELLKHYYHHVIDRDLEYTIGPYPIISYITKKEIEQKNLFIVAKGITSKMDKDELKRMIIE